MSENPTRRQLRVRGYHQKLLSDESTLWSIIALQIVEHGLAGLGDRSTKPIHLKRPYGVSGSPALPSFQLSRLIKKANTHAGGEFYLLEADRSTGDHWRGILCHWLSPYGISRPLASQPCHLTIQGSNDRRKPFHPLPRPLTWVHQQFLCLLMPE